jgi:hypothetical protein
VRPAGTGTTVALLEGGAEVARWLLDDGSGPPDLSTVNHLALLELAARRLGWSIRIRNPSPRLLELLDLTGLGRAVHTPAGLLVVEMGGQPEGGEQGGVEEVVVPDDPFT